MFDVAMFSFHTFSLLTLIVVVDGNTKGNTPAELLQRLTGEPYKSNDPEQAQQFAMSVVELLSSHTQQMTKLDEENKDTRSKLQTQDRKLKEMLNEKTKMNTAIVKLIEENESLSGQYLFLSDLVKRIEAENKRLSSQVENIEKKTEELTDTITLQALINNVTELQTRIYTGQGTSEPSVHLLEDTEDNISKRILLHSDADILNLVATHGTEIQNLQTDFATLKSDMPKGLPGSTYVRWGRNNCSGNGTELVYAGFAAGSNYADSGAAANYICLSPEPLWGHYNDANNAGAKVMGVEYELDVAARGDTTAFFHKQLHNEDAPCSVCRSPRPTVIMIPGRNQCYSGWTLEYKGYLAAGYYARTAASEYVCLDDNPDVMSGGHSDQNGALFYLVEGICGSLRCPPYVEHRELTCAVCSK